MKRLAIVGSGELGCLMAHHALADDATADDMWQVVGFYDDQMKTPRHAIGDLAVLGTTDRVQPDFDSGAFDCLMIGVGYAAMDDRRRLFDLFSSRIPMGTLVHASCMIDADADIGAGAFLMPGCIVDYGARVGENVTCQIGTVISHHCTIQKHAFLGPAVKLAGYVEIGEMSFVGCGVTSADCLKIGAATVIGAGAVVVDDIPANSLAVGVPARVIKQL